MSEIRVGMLVQIWTTAAPYGVVTKVNKKSFAVSHNLHGRTLFKLEPNNSRGYTCINNVHRCSLLTESANPIQYIYEDALYRGFWFTPELDTAIHSVYPNL